MELVTLPKGGGKTCHKHSSLKAVGKTFHIHFFDSSTPSEGMGKDIQCDWWCFGVDLDESIRPVQKHWQIQCGVTYSGFDFDLPWDIKDGFDYKLTSTDQIDQTIKTQLYYSPCK